MEILLQSDFLFSQPNMIPQLQLQEGKELNELPTNYLLPFELQRGPYVQSGQEVKFSWCAILGISSRDILPCLCTAVWIMNDSDYIEGKQQNKVAFSHFNIWLPLCSWAPFPPWYLPSAEDRQRNTPITALKCTQVCLTGSEERLVHFPWMLKF